ncbi:MAG: hypothetical protein ICV77_11310 [Cyanobacteria bacterium Co-bin8]|nr:hypothetical protein [Cyanobacteria bacterium Co-bin8]
MKSHLSNLKTSLSRLALIGLLQLALWLGVSLMPMAPALAAATPEAEAYQAGPNRQSYNPLSGESTQGGVDLEKAAEKAEQLSKDVFSGQETTMRIKGKTPQRNEAILHGRETASQKLRDMAERARSADAPADLSPKESRVLKNYQGQQ